MSIIFTARRASASTTPHSIKLSFPPPRVDNYLLSPPPILGGCAMQTHPTYHRLRASDTSDAKARVADYPHRILENSDPIAAQLTGRQGTETPGVRLTKMLSIRWPRDESYHRQQHYKLQRQYFLNDKYFTALHIFCSLQGWRLLEPLLPSSP
jgi:hypothetical protein